MIKKIISSFVIFSFLLSLTGKVHGQENTPLTDIYCAANTGCGTYISSVVMGAVNHVTNACSANGYGSYTSEVVAITIGQSVTVTITGANTNANTVCNVYVDWNKNANFNDPAETFNTTPAMGTGPYVAQITAPFNASFGLTRLRIRIGENSALACLYAPIGETEDYSINVAPALVLQPLGITNICQGTTLHVGFTTSFTFNSDNIFEAQLSDEFGSFSSYTSLGTWSGTGSGIIPCSISNDPMFGNNYRIRVASSSPATVSPNNGTNLGFSTPPVLQVVNPAPVCTPATVDITSAWTEISGITGTTTYWTDSSCTQAVAVPTAVTNSGTYYVKMTESGGCADVQPVEVTIHPLPVVNLGPDQTITVGNSVIIVPSVTSGVGPYTFEWSPLQGLTFNGNEVIASPISTTTYTVTVTDNGTGCSGTSAIIIHVNSGGTGDLQGTVTYDNNASTVMKNVTVNLLNGTNVISTTTTDNSGMFSFSGIAAGNYTLEAQCTKPWGGGNSVDALLIMKHFTGISLLSGIRVKAADVDNSNYVNSVDALSVMKRFVGMQPSFSSGNWYSAKPQVTVISGNTVTQNLKVICFGDVDGSYTPAP